MTEHDYAMTALGTFWWMFNKTTEEAYGTEEYCEQLACNFAELLLEVEYIDPERYAYLKLITAQDIRMMSGLNEITEGTNHDRNN